MSRFKSFMIAVVLLCASSLFSQKTVELARINVDGITDGITIADSAVCEGGKLEPCSWVPEEKRKQIMTFILPSSSANWKSFMMAYTQNSRRIRGRSSVCWSTKKPR